MTREEAVEFARKRFAVACGEGRRAARIDTRIAQLIHHVAHRQTLLDVFACEPVAARIKHMRALVEYRGGERYVSGNHEIA